MFGPTGTGIFGGAQPAEGHSWCPQRRMGVVTPLVVQCKLGAGPEKKAGCYVSQSMFRAIVLFHSSTSVMWLYGMDRLVFVLGDNVVMMSQSLLVISVASQLWLGGVEVGCGVRVVGGQVHSAGRAEGTGTCRRFPSSPIGGAGAEDAAGFAAARA